MPWQWAMCLILLYPLTTHPHTENNSDVSVIEM